MFRLYLITDPTIPDVVWAVERALSVLPEGAAAVQLRYRHASDRVLLRLGWLLRKVTWHFHAPLLINDRVDLALALSADGVHLRRDSYGVSEARRLGAKLVGLSTHHINEAQSSGADFVVFGPVWDTPGKGHTVGIEGLRGACEGSIPVFALGGVTAARVHSCFDAGAFGVACIRAVLGVRDPAKSAHAFWEALC